MHPAEIDGQHGAVDGFIPTLQTFLIGDSIPRFAEAIGIGRELIEQRQRLLQAILPQEHVVENVEQRGREIAGLIVLRDQLPGEVGVAFGIRVFWLETRRFIEPKRRLVPSQQGLKQLAAQEVIRGFVGNLRDRVVHLRERVVELAIFQEPLRLSVKRRRSSTQLIQALRRDFLTRLCAITLGRQSVNENAGEHIERDEPGGDQCDFPLVAARPKQDVFSQARVLRLRRKTTLMRSDVGLHFFNALIAIRRRELHRFHDHGGEPVRHAPPRQMQQLHEFITIRRYRAKAGFQLHIETGGRLVLRRKDRLHHLLHRRPAKRRAQREDRVEQLAEHVDIGARVDLIERAARLLGRNVRRRADDEAVHRLKTAWVRLSLRVHLRVDSLAAFHRARHVFCEAPIHHEHFAERADHDVVRLQVAMHHPLGMRERHGIADLLKNGDQRAERIFFQHRLTPVPQPSQHFLERDALHIFHRVKRLAMLIGSEFVHGHDIRVLELTGELRFVHKTQHVFPRKLIVRFHHLHRYRPPDAEIAPLHHHAHPTAPDRRDDFVFLPREHFAHRREPEIFVGKRRAQLCGGGGGKPDEQTRSSDLHFLIIPHARRDLHFHAVDEDAVARSEILNDQLIRAETQPRVMPRNRVRFDDDVATRIPPDDVFAVLDRVFLEQLRLGIDVNLRNDRFAFRRRGIAPLR